MYKISITKKAEKQLAKIPTVYFKSISKKIDELAYNPRPDGCKKLVDFNNSYRIRIGNYRVIYNIEDDHLIIEIIKVGTRQSVYD